MTLPLIQRGGIFDIGGVIAHDVWEGMYLHPERGLAAEHHLDRNELERIGKTLWGQFDRSPSRSECLHPEVVELAYWRAFAESVEHSFGLKLQPRDLVDLTDSFIIPVPEIVETVAKMREQGLPIALCSNNNVFWFARQWQKCDLGRYMDAGQAILSCDLGVTKSHPSGTLFHKAIGVTGLAPACLLFTDDRRENLEIAQRFGLKTACFELASPQRKEQTHAIRHFLLTP